MCDADDVSQSTEQIYKIADTQFNMAQSCPTDYVHMVRMNPSW